jgi:hypothetical protein
MDIREHLQRIGAIRPQTYAELSELTAKWGFVQNAAYKLVQRMVAQNGEKDSVNSCRADSFMRFRCWDRDGWLSPLRLRKSWRTP